MYQYEVTFTKEGRKGSLIIFAISLSEATSTMLHIAGIPSGFSIKLVDPRMIDTNTEYGKIETEENRAQSVIL